MHANWCVLIEISMETGMLNFWLGLLVTALTKETYFTGVEKSLLYLGGFMFTIFNCKIWSFYVICTRSWVQTLQNLTRRNLLSDIIWTHLYTKLSNKTTLSDSEKEKNLNILTSIFRANFFSDAYFKATVA